MTLEDRIVLILIVWAVCGILVLSWWSGPRRGR
jgi:hypothetical protein